MDIEKVSSACAVVQYGSMSEAARRLYRTQPAVSKHIAALEEEFGCRIFERDNRRLVLTPEGKILCDYFARVLKGYDDARNELYLLHMSAGGGLSFGATNYIGTWLVPAALSAFKQQHPQLQVHCTIDFENALRELLKSRRIRLALLPETEALLRETEISLRPIAVDRLALILPTTHHLAAAEVLTASMLAEETFLLPAAGSATGAFVSAALAKVGLHPRYTAALGTVQAIVQGVAGGMGISIVSERYAESEALRGRIVMKRPESLPLERRLFAVTLQDTQLMPGELAFLHMLQKQEMIP